MISNPCLYPSITSSKQIRKKVIYMAHNIRLRDIFVAKAIKRVRNLFTKWPISILFLMLQLMVVMSIKFSPLLCFFFTLYFFLLWLRIQSVDDYGMTGMVPINYKSRMQYGLVKGVIKKLIFNKRVIICRVVKWAFC